MHVPEVSVFLAVLIASELDLIHFKCGFILICALLCDGLVLLSQTLVLYSNANQVEAGTFV